MFRKILSALRRAVRGERQPLLAVRVEPVGSDAPAGDSVRTERAKSESVTERSPESDTRLVQPKRKPVARKRKPANRVESRGRRSYIAIEATTGGTGLVAERDYDRLTLASIKRAINDIRAKGYEPENIILEEHEARRLLQINFDHDDPLPAHIELFGLPVKIQR